MFKVCFKKVWVNLRENLKKASYIWEPRFKCLCQQRQQLHYHICRLAVLVFVVCCSQSPCWPFATIALPDVTQHCANCQIFIFLCVKDRLAMMHSSLVSHLRSQRSLTWSEHLLLGFSELRMCWTLIKFTKCQDATLGAGNIPEKVTWCDIRVMVGGDKIEIKIFDTFDSPGRPGY